jgi:hypothetical protein
VEDPNPLDAAERAQFNAAYELGAFADALGAYQRGLILRSLALIKAEGLSVAWTKPEPTSPYEWAGAMVAAPDQLFDAASEEVGYKARVARDTIFAVGMLQGLFEGQLKRKDRARHDLLGELVLYGVRMGGVEHMLGQTEGGLIDEYIALKWDKHQSSESRRRGANATKEAKAQKRREVLEQAQTMLRSNPTLSNDDLAFHLKQKARLPFAIRTLTGWIRDWRATDQLPPLKAR